VSKNSSSSSNVQGSSSSSKGTHNHPKPQCTRRNSSSSSNALVVVPVDPINEIHDQSYASHGNAQMDSAATPENSSISIQGDDDIEQSFHQRSRSGGAGDEFDEKEPEAKRW